MPGRISPLVPPQQELGSALPRHTPRQNRLLAALPAEDYARLLPALEPVALPAGWTVHAAGALYEYLYFITEGVVCRFHTMGCGKTAEFAITGNEGAIGIAAFLGGGCTPGQAVVLTTGYAYRLRAAPLQREFAHSIPLQQALLGYAATLMGQIGQTAVCKLHHSVEQRLCRWILSCVDRLPSNALKITQEVIARMLGVRRESVSEAETALKRAGLIGYSRGSLTVCDRPGLEARACECYAVLKRLHAPAVHPMHAHRLARSSAQQCQSGDD